MNRFLMVLIVCSLMIGCEERPHVDTKGPTPPGDSAHGAVLHEDKDHNFDSLSVMVLYADYMSSDRIYFTVVSHMQSDCEFSFGIEAFDHGEWREIDGDIYAGGKGVRRLKFRPGPSFLRSFVLDADERAYLKKLPKEPVFNGVEMRLRTYYWGNSVPSELISYSTGFRVHDD
jgi:hypothetical protein